MAHLAPHLSQPPVVFSPSIARTAASTAKDWSYVDGWLRVKYQTQRVPPFERNADTLKALLALAAHNEAADEERDQLTRIEAAALGEVKLAEIESVKRRGAYDTDEGGSLDAGFTADDVLQAIELGLPKEGKAALDAMASVAVELGVTYPTSEGLGCKLVELQGRAFDLQQTTERVALLQKYLVRESEIATHFLQELRGEEYRPPTGLPKQNLELQRQVTAMSALLPAIQQQVSSLETSVGLPVLTVKEVRKDEEDYLHTLSQKKGLDARVKAFAGLPPDLEAARAELEAFRTELRAATRRRDAGWEGLVERESPFKPRSRRPL